MGCRPRSGWSLTRDGGSPASRRADLENFRIQLAVFLHPAYPGLVAELSNVPDEFNHLVAFWDDSSRSALGISWWEPESEKIPKAPIT